MLRLLLVVAAVCSAQTLDSVTSQQPHLLQALGVATKALQAAQQSLEDALRTSPTSPALTSVSVVQDWSLVCKELCGAGLGLTPCAKHCATSGLGGAKIPDKDFDLIKCIQLQGTQSDPQCKGAESITNYGTRLCASFCYQRRRTLSGCSSCQLFGSLDEVSVKQSEASHGPKAKAEAEPGHKSLAQALAQIETRSDPSAPDWDELCKTLCQTGDGGSLCNCDLSPFFN